MTTSSSGVQWCTIPVAGETNRWRLFRFLGTVLVGILCAGAFGGNKGDVSIGGQLGTQLFAAIFAVVYTALATWVILKLVEAWLGLRVAAEAERHGLDVTLHEEVGYRF